LQVAMSKSGGRRSRQRFLLRDTATRTRFAWRRKFRSASGTYFDSPAAKVQLGKVGIIVGPFCRKGLRGSPRPATLQVAMSKSGGRRSRQRFLLRDTATRTRFAWRRKSRSASGTYFDSPAATSVPNCSTTRRMASRVVSRYRVTCSRISRSRSFGPWRCFCLLEFIVNHHS